MATKTDKEQFDNYMNNLLEFVEINRIKVTDKKLKVKLNKIYSLVRILKEN